TYEGSMGLRPKRTRNLWGAAPNPARFFEKSVGKTMFYRKVSHSLRSRDTLRLFLFYLKLNFSLTDEFMIGKWTRFRKNKICLFILLVREYCSGSQPQSVGKTNSFL